MRLAAISILLINFFHISAQSSQSQYLEAKRLFNEGNYRDSMGAFQSLTDDRNFGAYSTFYYALSAYHQEIPKVALDAWKQVRRKYPDWDQLQEVNFWIAKTSFDEKRYLDAVTYAETLPGREQLAANLPLASNNLKKGEDPCLKLFASNNSNSTLVKN